MSSLNVNGTATVALPPLTVDHDTLICHEKTFVKDFYRFLDGTIIYEKIVTLQEVLKKSYSQSGDNAHQRNIASCRLIENSSASSACFGNVFGNQDQIAKEKRRKHIEEEAQIRAKVSSLEKKLYEEIYTYRHKFFAYFGCYSSILGSKNSIIPLVEGICDIKIAKLPTRRGSELPTSDPLFIHSFKDPTKQESEAKELVIQGFKTNSTSNAVALHINCETGETSLKEENSVRTIAIFLRYHPTSVPELGNIRKPTCNLFYGLLFEARRRQHQREQIVSATILAITNTIPIKEIREMITSYISPYDPLYSRTTIITQPYEFNKKKALFHASHFVNPPKGLHHLAFDHYVNYTDYSEEQNHSPPCTIS